METYLSLKKCINGNTVGTAKELGLKTITVNKWQEPHTDFTDSGSYNPLDRINTIIHHSVREKNPPDIAYAPLYCLADEHKHICFPVPEFSCEKGLSRELHESIKEFGRLIASATEAMEDNRISRSEAMDIEEKGQHLVRHIMAFIQQTKEAIR
jgi:hypothetical protein